MTSENSANGDSGKVFTGGVSCGTGGSVMLAVSSEHNVPSGSALTSVGVSSYSGGWLLSITSGLSSFINGEAVTMVGGWSLVTIGGDTTMSTGSSADGSRRAVSLASSAWSALREYISLLGGREGLDIEVGFHKDQW